MGSIQLSRAIAAGLLLFAASCFTTGLWNERVESSEYQVWRGDPDSDGTVLRTYALPDVIVKVLLTPVTVALDIVTGPFQLMAGGEEAVEDGDDPQGGSGAGSPADAAAPGRPTVGPRSASGRHGDYRPRPSSRAFVKPRRTRRLSSRSIKTACT